MEKPAMEISIATPKDSDALRVVYADAFPDEELFPLVEIMLGRSGDCLSLVARMENEVVGHIAISRCSTVPNTSRFALLGPLAVRFANQRIGVGGRLIREGKEKMEAESISRIFVLGDPAYYGRHKFVTEQSVRPPYDLPDEWLEAWQSLSLSSDNASVKDRLIVPDFWQKPELWLP